MPTETQARKPIAFLEVSFVKADIRSKWQARLAQVFPIGYDKLPETDPSDEAFLGIDNQRNG